MINIIKIKTLIILIGISFCSYGQKGVPVYLEIDTVKDAETIYISLPKLTGFYSVAWEFYFEEVGGTSDGVAILQASNDTSYVTVNDVAGAVSSYPNDTIDISNGLVHAYWLYGTPANNFRVKITGTTGDTTRVISNYIRK